MKPAFLLAILLLPITLIPCYARANRGPSDMTVWITVAPQYAAYFSGGSQQIDTTREIFPAQVGDTHYEPNLDDSSFHLCHPEFSLQYYNTRSWFKDHKRYIEQYFRDHYTAPGASSANDQTGWITIRFIINCEGRTGWFRLSEMNTEYQPFHFSKTVSDQLLTLTKAIQGWQPAAYNKKSFDSYQYITFKLKKGTIECILP